MMYKTPIELEFKQFPTIIGDSIDHVTKERNANIENKILYEINEQVDVHVDRDELVKALAYDREQYSHGYEDGMRDGYEKGYAECIKKLTEFCKQCTKKDSD